VLLLRNRNRDRRRSHSKKVAGPAGCRRHKPHFCASQTRTPYFDLHIHHSSTVATEHMPQSSSARRRHQKKRAAARKAEAAVGEPTCMAQQSTSQPFAVPTVTEVMMSLIGKHAHRGRY